MSLTPKEQTYWNKYISTLKTPPLNPQVEANIPGNDKIADELLALFLNGKKKAASSLLADYKACDEALPKVGKFWIILNKNKNPKCIVKTTRVEQNLFCNITEFNAVTLRLLFILNSL